MTETKDFSKVRSDAIRDQLRSGVATSKRRVRRMQFTLGSVAAGSLALTLWGVAAFSTHPVQQMTAVEVIRATAATGGADRIFVVKSLDELLPNTVFTFEDPSLSFDRPGIVVGKVVDVTPGSAWKGDGATKERFDFAEPDVEWRSVFLQIEAVDAYGPVSSEQLITVGVSVTGSASPEASIQALESLSMVVAPLSRRGFYADNPEAFALMPEGLGIVDSNGEFSFPALRAEYADADEAKVAEEAFEGDAGSRELLATAAEEPSTTVKVLESGGIPMRQE